MRVSNELTAQILQNFHQVSTIQFFHFSSFIIIYRGIHFNTHVLLFIFDIFYVLFFCL